MKFRNTTALFILQYFLTSLNIKYNIDKVLRLYIDEINITPSINFQNKHLILGYAHNDSLKEATSMLIFLASHITNYS